VIWLARSDGREAKSLVFTGSAPVAQLDRASVYGTEGQRFESSQARSRRQPFSGSGGKPECGEEALHGVYRVDA
jgi:hypothetical protein